MRDAVVDMPAVSEIAAVAEAVFMDDGAGMVHKFRGLAPPRLVEVAGASVIMTGVSDMATARITANVARLIAMCCKIGDQRLEALAQRLRDSNRPRRRLHRHEAYRLRCGVRFMLKIMGLCWDETNKKR